MIRNSFQWHRQHRDTKSKAIAPRKRLETGGQGIPETLDMTYPFAEVTVVTVFTKDFMGV